MASGLTAGDLLQTTINFLAVGGLYALIALGYTLVYGILRFINFAHSDVVAWGGWIAFTVASAAGWLGTGSPAFALPVVLLVTMALCAALGVTVERLAYRPLRKAPRLNVLITAIGETKNFTGVTGTFSIDESRNAKKSAVIVEYKDGKLLTTTRIEKK